MRDSEKGLCETALLHCMFKTFNTSERALQILMVLVKYKEWIWKLNNKMSYYYMIDKKEQLLRRSYNL